MPSHAVAQFEDKKQDLVVKDFGGVNTQAGRTAIHENEFAWLENVMPVGHANMKVLPGPGDAVAVLPSGTISYTKYVNIANTDYLATFSADGSGRLLNLSTYAFTTIGTAGTFTLPVACAQWKNERLLIVDANNYYAWDGTTLLKNGFLESVTVTASGGAYVAIPTITFSGGGGTGAAAIAAMTLIGAQVVTAAGTGYVVGDILSLSGGTSSEVGKLRVNTVGGAGAVTGVSVYAGGSYTTLPASPNGVTGGSGIGCTITTAWGVTSVTVTNPGTVKYTSAPVLAFSTGAAAATAVLLAGPDGGTSIATVFGRVWIFKARTGTFSAPDSFVDFTVASAGGSFIVTDETLHSNINAAVAANNFLYIFGDASINVVSDVRVVPGTPYVTVFSNTNISAIIGSNLPYSIFPYYRNIGFATPFGFYALVGSTPQKISDALDGMFRYIDFTSPVSGGVVKLFNILCMAFCFQYDDPDPAINKRALLAIFFNKKWFFASQGAYLRLVTDAFQVGVPATFATDGSSVFKLFSQDGDSAIKVITPLWPMKEPTRTKETLKGGIELTTPDLLPTLPVQIDSDRATYEATLTADSTGSWINAAGAVGDWQNLALVSGLWMSTGFQIFQGDIQAFGRYVGYTVDDTISTECTINGLLMQYERKAAWATRA